MRRRLTTFAVALIAAFGEAQAQRPQISERELEARVRQVSAELRCPVCQALSLADSPSELSQEMKDVVRAQLAAGKTPDEVKAYFVGRYGEWILLKPEPRGFNLLVYALPVVAVLGGLGVVAYLARRWARRPDDYAGAGGGSTDGGITDGVDSSA